MPQPIHLRIFLSSPGDVADERAVALQVIERLPYDPLLRGQVTLEAIAWDKPGGSAPLLATMTPQQAINQGLPRPSECDIVVVLFWSRMGTPLPEDYRKPDGGRYLSGTEWEYEDAMRMAREKGRPDVLVYRRNEEIVLKPSDPQFMPRYEQWQRVEEFFASFVGEDGSILQGYNIYDTPDTFRQQFEQHLKALISRILNDPGERLIISATEAAPKLWSGSPFPGLRAFTPADAPIFFGRGRETDGLVRWLNDPERRFVAVVGASGSGKSSLVGAGLLPRLFASAVEGSGDWVVVRFTPGDRGDNPFVALAEALATNFEEVDVAGLAQRLQDDPALLVRTVERALSGRPHWAEVVLFVDQFEELFTVVSPAYRSAFTDMLAAANDRIRIVLTLRSDFYARCVDLPVLAELLREGSYPLAAPGLAALYEMIARPAVLAGLEFADGLVQRILDDTGDDSGALALLAYTLDELYRASHGAGLLAFAAYEALGGVQGAIGQRAENVFMSLDQAAREALPQIFRELVSINDEGIATRQRAPLERVASTPAASQLSESLTEARLLVQSADDGHAVVEVAHEALLTNWPRLAQWIDSVREDLSLLRQVKQAAHLWEQHGRSDDFLWIGERLKTAETMIARLQPHLSPLEEAFITPELERMMAEINDPETPHHRRVQIGDRLNEIGDTRLGVGLNADTIPVFDWCEVPGGQIHLGGPSDNLGLFAFKPFRIARYPVTYMQFHAFLDAPDGYANPVWWQGINPHRAPPSQTRPFDNHPVEQVSWYDAVAFCRWVSEKLGYRVRLPTDWEWQAAAGGEQMFPWGVEWDETCCNTRETKLNRTTAVGLYPQNASPYGVMDMIGNVWEWCTNELEIPGNVAFGGKKKRSLRGCSCLSRRHKANNFYRAGNTPASRPEAHGFRVCAPQSE